MLKPLFKCEFTPPLESPEQPKAQPIRNPKATIIIDGVEREITPEEHYLLRFGHKRVNFPDEMDGLV